MERQNITFSLPKEVLKKGRILAAERRISLNELVRDLLQKASDGKRKYQAAAGRQKSLMRKGSGLRTQGAIDWKRDELHQR
jgi:hypothetical protein